VAEAQGTGGDEHKRDRFSVATVLISAVAALLGAGVGAVTSIVVTRDQIHAEQRQADSTFLETQRQSAYRNLLNDGNVVYYDLADDILGFEKKTATSEDVDMQKVNDDVHAIELVGSPAAVKDALTVDTDANNALELEIKVLVRGKVSAAYTSDVARLAATFQDYLEGPCAAQLRKDILDAS
jgi:hypothetical protein